MAFAILSQRRVRLRTLCAITALCSTFASAATSASAPDQCIVSDRAIGCVSERATIDLATPRKDAGAIRDLVQQKLESGQCRLFGYGERVYLVSSKGTERSAVRRIGDRTTYWLPASWTRPAGECEANASSASLQAKLGMPDNTLPQQPDNTTPQEDTLRNGNVDRGDYAYRNDDDRDERAYRDGVEPRNDDRDARVYRSRDPDRDASDWHRREWDRGNPRYSRDGYAERARSRDDDDPFPRDDRYPPRAAALTAPLASSTYAHMQPGRDFPRPASCVYKPVMTQADLAACRAPQR